MRPSSRPTGASDWQPPSRRLERIQNANMDPPSIPSLPTEPAALGRPNSGGYFPRPSGAPMFGPSAQYYGALRSDFDYSQQGHQDSSPMSLYAQSGRRNTQPLPPQQSYYATPQSAMRKPVDSRAGSYPMPTHSPSPEFLMHGNQLSSIAQTQTPLVFDNQILSPHLLLQPVHQPLRADASGLNPSPKFSPYTTNTEQSLDEPPLDLTKPSQFVNDFACTFSEDTTALASFEALCKGYNKRGITETDFYVGVYRVILRDRSRRLLPAFLEFIPASWRDADLTWLNKAVETEYGQNVQQNDGSNSAVVTSAAQEPVRKKKRPVNGFTTSSHGGHLPSNRAPGSAAASSPVSKSQQAMEIPPCHEHAKGKTSQSALVKLPVKELGGKGNTIESKKSTKKLTKRAASTEPEASTVKKPRHTYGNTLGAEILHFGPIYSTRRAVLSRDTRPFIHANCGGRFSHPEDVKAHHKAKCHGNLSPDAVWDEHPSCHVGYTQLNYTRCKDGYVVLDQESHDKIEQAVAKGLKHIEEHGE